MQLNTETVTTKTYTLILTESELATIASGLRRIVNSFEPGTMTAVAKIMLTEINKKLPSRYAQLEFDYEYKNRKSVRDWKESPKA